MISLGYMELYRDDLDKTKDDMLPNVAIGDERKVLEAKILNKKTTPKKPYTESTLLAAMENAGQFTDDEELKRELKQSGIGTPATRAAIIERLIQVEYITRVGKNLMPTPKGMRLIELVPIELKSTETTGKWEKGLNSIAQGKMDKDRFMASIGRYINYIIQTC